LRYATTLQHKSNQLVQKLLRGGGGRRLTDRNLNSLLRYHIAQRYRILHIMFQRLFQHNLKISYHCHCFVKQNNDSNQIVRMSMIVWCTKLYLSKRNGLWVVFIKPNMNFNFQLPSTLNLFLFFTKAILLKSSSACNVLSECKMSWSDVECCKFSIHFRSSNFRHFGSIFRLQDLIVRLCLRGNLQRH
jgi:hypothetical protein